MNESILCMNGTLQTVYDQQNEINRLRKVVNSMKSGDHVDFSNAIEGTILISYCFHLMSGSCHLDRASYDEFSVECLF